MSGDRLIVMYHGALMRGRGLETFIKVVEQMPEVYGVMLGYGDSDYEEKLKSIIAASPAEKRLAIHPAVPQKELYRYIAAADIEYVAVTASHISYYLSLPNKLMESIQAGTPVVGSDFPEIGGLLKEWQIGVTCDPDDIDSICAAILQLSEDKALYANCRSNMRRARKVLCWEEEGKKLRDAFLKLVA